MAPQANPQFSKLSLQFDLPLWHRDIPRFRGALAALVKRQDDLFHNHDNDAERERAYKHRYPLIQYRVQEGYAAVIGFNAGAEALEKLRLSGRFAEFKMNGEHIPLHVLARDSDRNLPLAVLPEGESMRYRLLHYIPFGAEKYHAYKALPTLMEKLPMLQNLVRNHIVAFAYGVGWTLPAEPLLRVEVEDIDKVTRVLAVGTPMMAFDLHFRVNALLPSGIGIGRKTAFGFGGIEN